MQSLMQNLRFGVRTLRARPGVSFAAVLTLALGLGVTTAVFSLAHGVLLQALPYPAPDRLVAVWALLYGISGNDALTYAFAAVFVLALGLLACWVPARRAARVDPMGALRVE